MKKDISSLELYYLAKELRYLENSKIDRIYHSKEDKSELVIALHLSGEGKKFLKIMLPGTILIEDIKDDYDTPTGLCMGLRKYLEGGMLRQVSQSGFERVIKLLIENKIEGKKSTFILFIELFSKGNIIFCDEDMLILNILEEQHWKDRELKRQEKYIPPKSAYDVLNLDEKKFSQILKDSEKESIVKALAIEFNLGGIYAEELCFVCGVDKKIKTTTIDEKTVSKLYKNFKQLFVRTPSANYSNNNALPFELEMYKDSENKKYQNFNEAIAQNLNKKDDKTKINKEKNIEKLKLIIDEQHKNLEEFKKEYDENQKKGEAIYENYKDIDEILKTLREAREKFSWKEIKEKISKDPKFSKIIKDINEKNNEIRIELK